MLTKRWMHFLCTDSASTRSGVSDYYSLNLNPDPGSFVDPDQGPGFFCQKLKNDLDVISRVLRQLFEHGRLSWKFKNIFCTCIFYCLSGHIWIQIKWIRIHLGEYITWGFPPATADSLPLSSARPAPAARRVPQPYQNKSINSQWR